MPLTIQAWNKNGSSRRRPALQAAINKGDFMFLRSALFATILAITFNAQCNEKRHPQFDDLKRAVLAMQEQATDNFVVVQIPQSDSFFQFSADTSSGYIFDVPAISLTEEQKDRARTFFAGKGVQIRSVEGTNPETMESFSLQSFQARFSPDDAIGGASLGFEFMSKVLEYSGEVQIIEGWK